MLLGAFRGAGRPIIYHGQNQTHKSPPPLQYLAHGCLICRIVRDRGSTVTAHNKERSKKTSKMSFMEMDL